MPIVTISTYHIEHNNTGHSENLQDLAEKLNHIFLAPKGSTWVKIHNFSGTSFCRDTGSDDPPIICNILKADLPDLQELQHEISSLIPIVADFFGYPNDKIDIIYDPPGRGRVAFGGKILE